MLASRQDFLKVGDAGFGLGEMHCVGIAVLGPGRRVGGINDLHPLGRQGVTIGVALHHKCIVMRQEQQIVGLTPSLHPNADMQVSYTILRLGIEQQYLLGFPHRVLLILLVEPVAGPLRHHFVPVLAPSDADHYFGGAQKAIDAGVFRKKVVDFDALDQVFPPVELRVWGEVITPDRVV